MKDFYHEQFKKYVLEPELGLISTQDLLTTQIEEFVAYCIKWLAEVPQIDIYEFKAKGKV